MLAALKRLWSALGTLVSRDIAVLTNAIAFNFLLCLFPLLLVLAGLSQRYQGSRAAAALALLLQELIPFGQQAIADSLRSLTRMARGLAALSLLLIVWGSSGIFMPVEMALNRAWGGRPSRNFFLSRGLAFLMTVAGGLLVLVSVAITVFMRSYGRDWPMLAGLSAKASAFLMTYALFFLIYRVIPSVPVGNRVALKAAFWGGAAWEAVKYGFVVKLGTMHLQAFYGPLALSVSLLLWAYVSSLVLVFGALMSPVRSGRLKG
jgi:membrane protein/epoxyqueuosine reductase